MPFSRFPFLAILVAFVAACTASTATDAAAQPNMVEPESLEQGFIIVVEDEARKASADSPIYLASNHSGWGPDVAEWILTPRSDSKWQIVIDKLDNDARMAFKFTRGSWDTAEIAADGNDIENRLLPLVDASKLTSGERPVIELKIANWADNRPSNPKKASTDRYRDIPVEGTLKRVQVVGGGVSVQRDLLVWLPPGYDSPENADKSYPVLYLNDGQNVFQQLHGVPGEWLADETATALINAGTIQPLIIVGVPHLNEFRAVEYLPVQLLDSEARGDEYVSFLINEVLPRVESTFRVRTGPESTAIGGASLGAVISLHAASMHPEIFGMVLSESNPLLARGGILKEFFDKVPSWRGRFFIGISDRESGDQAADSETNRRAVQSAHDFADMLKRKGVRASDLKVVVGADQTHNEQAWAARLPEALKFLFPSQ